MISTTKFIQEISAIITTTLMAITPLSAAQEIPSSLTEEVIHLDVKTIQGPVTLETTIFKPEGRGPFPLLIMNHGKEFGQPEKQARARYLALSREFVQRGYAVVIPMRQGFSKSGGSYRHAGCNIQDTGTLQASDILAVLNVLRVQPWVDADHIVVGGHSFGGLAVLALGTEPLPGVKGLINFAGGIMIKDGACDWKTRLELAITHYGNKNRVPSLWIYGDNDSLFDIRLAEHLQRIYTSSGGIAELINVGTFGQDAHRLALSHHGAGLWWPATERFLRQVGMPTLETGNMGSVTKPTPLYKPHSPPEAVAKLSNTGQAGYQKFLSQPFPRAFAMSPSGAWSWSEDGDDPAAVALAQCQKHANDACQLFAVNEEVVWNAPVKLAMATNRKLD
jgi:dienelactone hydrolase